MSTIPTTFNENFPSYTVIGGRENFDSSGISVVLLNRGGRYARRGLFHDLEKTGFDTVVSVEPEPAHYDLDDLSARFPFVRFVLPHTRLSLGEQINMAVSELDSPLFFVLWNDLKMIAGGTAHRMAERLTRPAESNGDSKGKIQFRRLCTVPVIQNSRLDTIPTVIAPVIRKKKIQTRFLNPSGEGLPSLYPFDGVGIYDRERFIQLGGFDGTLKNSFWQLMDFGFRAYLWGEEISLSQTLKFSYEAAIPAEDNSTGNDYFRFYLKNLAPVFRNDCAYLPVRRFPGFLFKANNGIFDAWDDFSESRRWVNTNSFRWRCNTKTIASYWNLETRNKEK
jgi:hypothetical protein